MFNLFLIEYVVERKYKHIPKTARMLTMYTMKINILFILNI